MLLIGLLVLLVIVLPAPAWGKNGSISFFHTLKSFIISVLELVFSIVVPLGVFILSAFLLPEAKSSCKHGWLDCFFLGKMILLPLILWAVAAMYFTIIQADFRNIEGWMHLGLFTGVFVSSICLVHGLCYWKGILNFPFALFVCFYTPVWYGICFWQTRRNYSSSPYLITALSSVPFWIASIFYSKYIYRSLPETPSDCFVATAASRGHASLVGPFYDYSAGGCQRRVNKQMLTLWSFEMIWQEHLPCSHRMFRRFYNRYGYWLARHITNPWRADIAYFFIKPFEIFARLIGRLSSVRSR